MKLISWNVNGLRACLKKGFEDTFNQLDADVFCIQETKMQPGQADLLQQDGVPVDPRAAGTAGRFAASQPGTGRARFHAHRIAHLC